MQNQVSVGKSEVKYLCECYDRVHDLVLYSYHILQLESGYSFYVFCYSEL